MNAFIVLPQNLFPDRLVLSGEEARHCSRVLRMHAGEQLIAIDGAGCAYRATILTAEKNAVECAIDERLPGLNEPSLEVVLGIALLKHSAKFDIVVEKAVELGVSAIVPMVTERCERQTGNTKRWRGITESATKQSLRCRIPSVAGPVPLAGVFSARSYAAIAIAHEKAPTSESFSKFLETRPAGARSPLLILIGPEGGFTEDECLLAERAGAQRVSLGSIRLRVETAAMLAVGLALHS